MSISDIRQDYKQDTLDKKDLLANPLEQFEHWLNAYIATEALDPTAMVVATVDAHGRPWQRVLLLKGVDDRGLVFFTNYNSNKGQHLAENASASAHFFWPAVERQVSFIGSVEKIAHKESESYFHSRPKGSQIGALASAQSQPLASRDELEQRVKQLTEEFADESVIPMPDYWGGYRLIPERVEFWQGRSSRLHDRFEYVLEGNQWMLQRLQP